MDKLPTELYDLIVLHLQANLEWYGESSLAPYAAISRAWQYSIEAITFSSFGLSSKETSLRQFDTAFADLRRRALLMHLEYTVELPRISKKRVQKLQGRRERAANNAAYTRAVYRLFKRLSVWETRTHLLHSRSFRLNINIKSPLATYEPQYSRTQRGKPAWPVRADGCFIEFDASAVGRRRSLPPIPCVDKFDTKFSGSLHPSFLAVYANALPNVERMRWHLYSPGRRCFSSRKEIRSSLARTLLHASFDSLVAFEITWTDLDPSNHAFDPGNLLDSGSRVDFLSMGVRRLSQLPRLQLLTLKGCHILSPAVFSLLESGVSGRDDIDSEIPASPLWPSLINLYIELSITTPAGNWYLTGNPASQTPSTDPIQDPPDEPVCNFDSADSDTPDFIPSYSWDRQDGIIPTHEFRFQVDSVTFSAFMIAAARAVRYMSRVRGLEFIVGARPAMQVEFLGPGEKGMYSEYCKNVRDFLDEHHLHGKWVIFLPEDYPYMAWNVSPEVKEAVRLGTGRDDCLLVVRGSKVVKT